MIKESELSRERLTPDVSIVINVHNQPLTLKLSLRSVLSQDYRGLQELIVVDDGSSSSLFEEIHEEFDEANIPIRYVWQQSKGMRELNSFNNGIKLARGNYLAFLAGDMVPNLDFVRKHMETHTQPKLIVAGNRNWRGEMNPLIFESLDGKPIQVILNDLEHDWETDDVSKKREQGENERRREWLRSQHPWRACFACNLSVPNNSEIQFDENYFGWGNYDQELGYRLYSEHGYKPVYREDIHAYHLETSEAVANVFRTRAHEDIVNYMRNTLYFFDKCRGLEPEEVFYGFPRFELDEISNTWQVVERPEEYTNDQLNKKVSQIRKWLEDNEIYS